MSAEPVIWIDAEGVTPQHRLFGVSTLERLRRTLKGRRVILSSSRPLELEPPWPGAQADCSSEPLGARLRRALAGHAALIAIDGTNAVDPRLFRFNSTADSWIAERGGQGGRAVALKLNSSSAPSVPPDAHDLPAVADALRAYGAVPILEEREFPSYIDKLRRSIPFWLYPLNDAKSRRALERRLFWDNYKGSTDLLTAYVYPPLVWPLVRFSAHFRIHPNLITALSVLLAFAAVPLFARAHWLGGFLCAYAMSILDSVDGKLARLTLTDSNLGNTLDHGLDQIHPPFWYAAWAVGLGARSTHDVLMQVAMWLIAFYIADRIVLGIAKRRLGHALHSSTRLDEHVRGIIARRNIVMTVFGVALLLGAGPAGLYLVALWQTLTFVWHGFRTLWLGFLSPAHSRARFLR